jgi:hypothetical protein
MSLRFALLLLMCLRALNTLAQDDAYFARRDSILHSLKMQAGLKEDSMLYEEAYFMRRNHVRVMIRTEGSNADSSFFNEWGAPEHAVSYIDNQLWFEDRYAYDAFGNVSGAVHLMYYDGAIESRLTRQHFYAEQADGLSELLMKTEDIMVHYDHGVPERRDTTVTAYTYDRNNRLASVIRTKNHWHCPEGKRISVENVTYEYDKRGDNRRQISYISGSCETEKNCETEMQYNASHQLVRRQVMSGSDTLSVTEWEIGINGRENQYRHKEFSTQVVYERETFYQRNGLELQYTVADNSAQRVTKCTYVYYTGNGTKEKRKNR